MQIVFPDLDGKELNKQQQQKKKMQRYTKNHLSPNKSLSVFYTSLNPSRKINPTRVLSF